MRKFLIAAATALVAAGPAWSAEDANDVRLPSPGAAVTTSTKGAGVPGQLDAGEREAYRAIFRAIRDERWADAQLQLDAVRPGPLHAFARAELFTARNSPKVELAPLLTLLGQAPDLPQAPALARLASVRGAAELPLLPEPQRLIWNDGAPNRLRAKAAQSDAAAAALLVSTKPFVKADDGAGAEALVEAQSAVLTPDALTEWRQRVAWIYFVAGDDANARRVAALAQAGVGEWRVQADWTQALAAWRQNDCATAQVAFANVAQRATDIELRSAGLYWASRADIACARPDLVQGRLQAAAQYGETYYGLLARQALATVEPKTRIAPRSADWQQLERRPNVKLAAALVEVGEHEHADSVLKFQARIGGAGDYPALTRLAGVLNLPKTQLWLSHMSPAGATPVAEARFPMPDWTPDGGWRVDKSLVFAHALQESKFDPAVVSPAGAYGLMQIMPAQAIDYSRAHGGLALDRIALTRPGTNIEVGQSYLERLRDMQVTGGLLPKVIAAYNAGPVPVEAWNSQSRDGGDPLLYIESIPYWETRGYVMTVLRNYWMYERQAGSQSASRAALAQGMWPRFPGLKGAPAVRMARGARGARTGGGTSIATAN